MQYAKHYVVPEDESMVVREAAIAYSFFPNANRGKEYVERVEACAFTNSQLRDVVAYSMEEVAKGNYYTAQEAREHFLSL